MQRKETQGGGRGIEVQTQEIWSTHATESLPVECVGNWVVCWQRKRNLKTKVAQACERQTHVSYLPVLAFGGERVGRCTHLCATNRRAREHGVSEAPRCKNMPPSMPRENHGSPVRPNDLRNKKDLPLN